MKHVAIAASLGDNRKVSLVNDPHTWTLLGVFAALMLGGMTLISTSTNRVIRSSIDGLRGEIDGLRGELRAEVGGLRGEMNSRFEAVDAKFEGLRGEMNARFDTVNSQIQHLDRDVAALTTRHFGGPTDT